MRLPSSYRYFDHAAGWPVREEALTAYVAAARACGNPGSVHRAGQRSLGLLDAARADLAASFGCEADQVTLVSSATEANNLSIEGTVRAWRSQHAGIVPRVIVSSLEHDSVRVPAARMADAGEIELVTIGVDQLKGLDIKELESLLTQRTALVSIMHVSNETGVTLPIARTGRMIAQHRDGAPWPRFHVDAAQAPAFVEELATEHADLVTYSGYKLGAVAGCAALVIKDASLIRGMIVGGGQERGLRSGTEDVAAASSFARAASRARSEVARQAARLEGLRTLFVAELARVAPGIEENVPELARAPHIVSLWVPGVHAQQTLARLDLAGFAIGAGSACSARSLEPSKALLALGYGKERAQESVRVSLGSEHDDADVIALAEAFRG